LFIRIVIAILALVDGVLHLALDQVLFRGNFGFFRLGEPRTGPPPGGPSGGPPPGPRPPDLPLPLNELFVLNFVGWVVLVAAFWLAPRAWRWLVEAAMIVYTLAIIGGWMYIWSPNPMNLGYLSKTIEVALIAVLLLDLLTVLRTRTTVASTSS
jgi:hypothetical protein